MEAPLSAPPAPLVVGRDTELARLTAFLGATGDRAGALLLDGEAGVGKTTLLRWAIGEARRLGRTVLLARPGETESQLAFAGLTDLFEAVGDDILAGLPDPQRRGLAVALRRAEGATETDPLTMSQAVLGVLRAVSASGPTLVALDDAQWLDAPTARVLEFALRRLDAEPVALLAAVRGTDASAAVSSTVLRAVPADRLERIDVGPLGVETVGRLIGERLGRVPGRTVAARIRELSGGNPFYALEIGRAWLAAVADVPGAEPAVPESLAGLVRARLERLSTAGREAALVAAVALQPAKAILVSAMGEGPAGSGLADAAAAGILEEGGGGRLSFTHPLLAWAAYAEAPAEDRLAVHARLADVAHDPDERVRHRAVITTTPDESVAMDLDAAVARAHDRGAPETAAELALEARRLTPPGDAGAIRVRTLAAAELLIQAADPARARALLERYVNATPPGPNRAAALQLLADIRSGDDWEAKLELLEGALAEAASGSRDRAEIEVAMGVAHWALVRDLPAGLRHVRSGLACAEAAGDPAVIVRAIASVAFLEVFVGDAEHALDLLDRGIALEAAAPSVRLLFRPSYFKGLLLEWSDRLPEARASMLEVLEAVDRAGDSDSRPLVLLNLATVARRLGDWVAAAGYQDAAEIAAALLGHASSVAMAAGYRAELEARRGDVERARAAASTGIELARRSHAHWTEQMCLVAIAEAELSLGNHRAALDAITPAAERLAAAGVPHALGVRIVPVAAEAAALAGEAEEAERLLDRMRGVGNRLDLPSTLRAWHRVRALLAAAAGDLEAALGEAEASLRQAQRIDEPFELARARLVHAEILRRLRRRAPAREAAAASLATFEALGARVWAERARAELARTGVPSGGDGRASLTPTQRQVADLVVAGRTNREVAAALFMSPHTVEAHLTSIYRALGIRSRTDLARVMAAGGGGPED